MEWETYGFGGENVFLEEGEPRRELLDDCRAVARGHEVDSWPHRRACCGSVEERGDVYERGALYACIYASKDECMRRTVGIF